MLEFDFDGHLKPYGAINIPLVHLKVTLEAYFVQTKHREDLLIHYLSFLEELLELLNFPAFQYLDGSFVTNKFLPRDLDLVTFIDYRDFEAHENELKTLLADLGRRSTWAAPICRTVTAEEKVTITPIPVKTVTPVTALPTVSLPGTGTKFPTPLATASQIPSSAPTANLTATATATPAPETSFDASFG